MAKGLECYLGDSETPYKIQDNCGSGEFDYCMNITGSMYKCTSK